MRLILSESGSKNNILKVIFFVNRLLDNKYRDFSFTD